MGKFYAHINLFTIFIAFCLTAKAQKDTLPDFAVKNINGTIEISWHNLFKNTIQINIQRSKESNKNFVTIHATPDPTAKYYRFIDKTAPNDSSYYRIFMLFEGTNYLFSKVLRPVITTVISKETSSVIKTDEKPRTTETKKDTIAKKTETTTIPVKVIEKKTEEKTKAESIIKKEEVKVLPEKKTENIPVKSNTPHKEVVLQLQQHTFRYKISLAVVNSKIAAAPVINNKKIWAPSSYIFTADDGNVMIRLPDIQTKKYSVTFLKEEGRPLFVISTIKESPMVVDKSSFLKSGWYYFELKEGDKVMERNKFLITRDY